MQSTELSSEPRSQAAKAYWMLAARIMRLELPPGAVLLDKDLTAELGIGRTPIREALQRLAVEGLVVHYPHRGSVVSDISATTTRDIYEFRSLIDSEAARLAAIRRTDEQAQALVALSHQLVQHARGDDVDIYIRTNRALYEALGQACQNTYLAETIPRIFNLHIRLWFFISKMEGGWHRLAVEHSGMSLEMSEAIAAQDPDAAALAVKVYVSERQKDMRKLI